jgi:hypothetical protein
MVVDFSSESHISDRFQLGRIEEPNSMFCLKEAFFRNGHQTETLRLGHVHFRAILF